MTTTHLIREEDAAAYLGLSPKTLSRWRWSGKGPTFHKLGSSVRYKFEELDAFVVSSVIVR